MHGLFYYKENIIYSFISSLIAQDRALKVKDLVIVNDKFLTENGADILDIYEEKFKSNPYTKDHAGAVISYYNSILYKLARNGFDSIPDLSLSILYEDNELQDIGQAKNYSKRQ